MAIPFAYNLRSVLNRPISTATTAIGIGLTVAIYIGALALADGFKASLVSTGSPDNVIVLRKGADSEISSGITLEQSRVLAADPAGDWAVVHFGRTPFTAAGVDVYRRSPAPFGEAELEDVLRTARADAEAARELAGLAPTFAAPAAARGGGGGA